MLLEVFLPSKGFEPNSPNWFFSTIAQRCVLLQRATVTFTATSTFAEQKWQAKVLAFPRPSPNCYPTRSNASCQLKTPRIPKITHQQTSNQLPVLRPRKGKLHTWTERKMGIAESWTINKATAPSSLTINIILIICGVIASRYGRFEIRFSWVWWFSPLTPALEGHGR